MEIDFQALVATFKAEAEEGLGHMEEALVALEGSPGDKKLLQIIFRVAHTLKGNAATLGYTGVTEFAHRVEDWLDLILKGQAHVDAYLISCLLSSVDLIRRLIADSIAGSVEMKDEHREALARLESHFGVTSSGPAEANPPIVERRSDAGRRLEDAQGRGDRTRTIRVDIDKLDRILNLTGEIAIARDRVRQMLAETPGGGRDEILEAHRDSDHLYLDLQELVMEIRMVAIGPTFRQYIRTVRDLVTSSEKQARLEIEGEEVEVDTAIVNLIRDPLTHMLRNAVDHGIETPDVRKAAGKDPCGRICMRAYRETGSMILQMSDDGAGLNRKSIEKAARAGGLIAEPEKMPDAELFELIFEPGFSTAEKVTDVSGRGVGMDIVRRNIEALRGTVTVDSEEGKGTIFTIRLPLTLAIIEGFHVGIGHETYVLPLDSVVECIEMPTTEPTGALQGVINLRGEPLPYIRLGQVLGTDGQNGHREQIVVVRQNDLRAGLVVDALYGESQTVIKPLGQIFKGLARLSGSTILGNGQVALILDVTRIVREFAIRKEERVHQ